jgi:predicted ATP-grasp superfamily ATP-dependent carboligase
MSFEISGELPTPKPTPFQNPAHRLEPLTPSADTAHVDLPGIAGCTVLVSDENYKSSLGIVRHLGQLGAQVSMLACSENSLACRSRYCREVILSRTESLEAMIETALQTVKRKHFDVIIPVGYMMTLALARRRDEFIPHTHLEVLESETIELAANKVKMVDLARKLDVPAPRTFLASEISSRGSALMFPLVVKPQKESPGRSPIRYARDFEELNNILSGQVEGKPRDPEDTLVQEFIPGYGCGFFATYQKGVCKRVFMHRRVREYPATGGISTCAESFYDPKLQLYGRRMLDALNWHGVAMVEFRRDSRDGEYKLMEINQKFWGSVDLPLAAGADFPGDLCQMALGRTLTFTDRYQRNLRFQWPLSGHGDLFHLWTRPQSIFDVALDFLNPRVKSNVWPSDFAPNLKELRGLAVQLLRKGRR